MKEINAIIKAYNETDFSKNRAALVTVVKVQGSSYRRTGARMLVLDNGIYLGGISGGCLEGDALRRAQKAIYSKMPSIITYDTTQEDGHQVGVGLGCNGIIDVLITPLVTGGVDAVRLLSQVSQTRVPRILVSITGCQETPALLGNTVLFEDDKQFTSSFRVNDISEIVLKNVRKVLENQNSETATYHSHAGLVDIFFEVIMPAIHLIIYGSNYDILTLSTISKELGWRVTVVTNTLKATKMLLQTANSIIDSKSNEQPVTDSYTAIVLMAHDYKTDLDNLKKALNTAASYIGILGPRKRSERMFETLQKENIGLSIESMQRIYAPCGLDIGAANPEEIALSINAEIKAHFTGRKGMSLKYRQGKIYSD